MKLLRNNRLFAAYLAVLVLITVNGCNKTTDFDNKIYFAQSVASKIVPVTIDNGKGVLQLSLVSALVAEQNLEGTISILDNSYLETYNKANNTNFIPLPSSVATISNQKVAISKGKASSDAPIAITITDWSGYIDGTQYALPIKLTSNTNTQVLPGSDVIIVAVNKVINTVAAQTSAGFTVNAENVWGKGNPVNNFTVEGKFLMTRSFIVPGNWRSDLFIGFGLQFVVLTNGGIEVRLPNSAFMYGEKPLVAIPLNTWTHFAITYKDSIITLYINGEQIGSSYKYSDLPLWDFSFGGYTNGCNLSEFRVWSTVRSRQQIKTFACAVDPATPGLAGYWRFNDGTGTLIKDVSSKGNNLATTGAVNWIPGVKCP